jgi:hypothetical protein
MKEIELVPVESVPLETLRLIEGFQEESRSEG